jgi:hypothetical protein
MPPPSADPKCGLFVFVGFSDDRRLIVVRDLAGRAQKSRIGIPAKIAAPIVG